MLKVGVVGLGTVGSALIGILNKNSRVIEMRCGKKIEVVLACVKDLNKKRSVDVALTNDVEKIINDPQIDVVVELMGGVDEALSIVSKALKANKHVVTANKALLAYHRYELSLLSQDKTLAYEASVGGGVPIIKALRDSMGANNIMSIKGIINGTCNYMLTKMTKDGVDFDEVLKEAQDLGYAEADPTFDIGGFDASHKLLILASIAYNIDAKPEDILIEGIEEVTTDDIEFAKEFGFAIKHLAIAQKNDDGVSLRVHPTLVPKEAMIAKVDGVLNAISVVGDCVGETMYYGPGAGGNATASAVVGDLIEIARSNNNLPTLGYKKTTQDSLELLPKDAIRSRYYLRILAKDESGVLAQIANVFAKYEISIETFLQKNKDSHALLLLSTHASTESSIQQSLNEIASLSSVMQKPSMIRIDT